MLLVVPQHQSSHQFSFTKACSRCGTLNTKIGGSKWFRCVDPACGFEADRDENAADGIFVREYAFCGSCACGEGPEEPYDE